MRRRPAQQQRRGTITALAALLIVFLLGMVAFAVDVGWMTLSQTELQHAADSAALAGANQLMSGFVQYNLPGQTSTNQTTILNAALASARSTAQTYAGYNGAGGV